MFKEIFRNFSALGGYGYRALSDGENRVKIQRRYQNGKWHTMRYVSQQEWCRFVEDVDLLNVYDQNPNKLAEFAEVNC